MTDDLISRQKAINTLKMFGAEHNAIAVIRGLPPAQQWIPVTERVPETRDWHLGIFRESDTGWINPIPFICDYVGYETEITTKDFWILKTCDDQISGLDYYRNLECVAWMPLPKPWEGESE